MGASKSTRITALSSSHPIRDALDGVICHALVEIVLGYESRLWCPRCCDFFPLYTQCAQCNMHCDFQLSPDQVLLDPTVIRVLRFPHIKFRSPHLQDIWEYWESLVPGSVTFHFFEDYLFLPYSSYYLSPPYFSHRFRISLAKSNVKAIITLGSCD
jgi:hypothetical protein